MIVSVASGKGGTGKTTVAVNLALSLGSVQLLDCDVEEPNSHLFLKPEIKEKIEVKVRIPRIDEQKCTRCGKCADFCRYNALALAGEKVMVFKELCHTCGGCAMICPVNAITEVEREIGILEKGSASNIDFAHGLLNIGEAMSAPLIHEVKEGIVGDKDVVIDAPPGTSCAVIESVKDSDYCILVTEPTPFGLHDLEIAVEMLEQLGIPHGVVVNRDGIGDERVEEYCQRKEISVLLKIPYDRRIAELYSNGIPFTQELIEYREEFKKMFDRVREVTSA